MNETNGSVVSLRPSTLDARGGSNLDRIAYARLGKRLQTLADRASEVARRLRDGDRVLDRELVSDTAQGDLRAAGAGWLGVCPAVAKACLVAVKSYEAALRARADRDAAKRRGNGT